MHELDPKDLGREDTWFFANLMRRIGDGDAALKVLRPYVRPSVKNQVLASSEEKLEYAMALIKVGAINEALRLLDGIDPLKYPNRSLYASFGHISQWNYLAAARDLESYLSHPDVEEYQRLTARVNLLSCYIFVGNLDGAKPLLDALLESTRLSGVLRLRRNILNLAAQAAIALGDWEAARQVLDEAASTLTGQGASLDQALIDKWSLVLALNRDGPHAHLEERLWQLRQRGLQIASHELVRDMDYYRGLFFKKLPLLNHVYFGSPFASYREKIREAYAKMHGESFSTPDVFAWVPGEQDAHKAKGWIRVADGRNSFGASYLKPEQLKQKLFVLLAKDFYRPVGLYQIHDELFDDEQYFNPLSTPKKIHQILFRLNEWFREAGIPMEAASKEHFFALSPLSPLQVLVGQEKTVDPKLADFCARLRTAFGQVEFRSQDVCERLGLVRRTATELLKKCVEEGLLTHLGGGPTSRFTLTSSKDLGESARL